MKKIRKKVLVIGAVAVAVLIVLGIVLYLTVFSFTDPITTVLDIKFVSFDQDRKGFLLALTIVIDSPNTFDLKIIRITGDIYIDSALMGSLDNETGTAIPGHSSGDIVLSVHIKDEQMKVYTGKELKVRGSTLGKYLIFQKESPFEETKPLTPGGNQTERFPPIAIITGVHKAEPMQNVQFSGVDSYDKDGMITSYSWDFGDGSTATGEDVSHRYSRVGMFTVTLEVADNDGLHSTALHEIVVTLIP